GSRALPTCGGDGPGHGLRPTLALRAVALATRTRTPYRVSNATRTTPVGRTPNARRPRGLADTSSRASSLRREGGSDLHLDPEPELAQWARKGWQATLGRDGWTYEPSAAVRPVQASHHAQVFPQVLRRHGRGHGARSVAAKGAGRADPEDPAVEP